MPVCDSWPQNPSGDRVINAQRRNSEIAEVAAHLVDHGMTVGLGAGSAVTFWLPPLAHASLDTRCVATSPRMKHAARELGLRVGDFTSIQRFDIAIGGRTRKPNTYWHSMTRRSFERDLIDASPGVRRWT